MNRLVNTMLCCAVITVCRAGTHRDEFPQGVSILQENPLMAFALSGSAKRDAARQMTAVDGPSFHQSLQVRTLRRPSKPWDIQLVAKNARPIRKGDVLLADFFVRCGQGQSERGYTEFVFEQSSPPFQKATVFPVVVGTQWRHIQLPFKVYRHYRRGQAQMALRVGYAPQCLEFGGITLLNYGPDTPPYKLPYTPITYEGRRRDAAWRKTAEERIEKMRKGDLVIRVVDEEGLPVPHARVQIDMQRHAFGFGTAVEARWLVGNDSKDARIYRETVTKLFNKAVLCNALKWHSWAWGSPEGRRRALDAVHWLQEHGIPIRGHTLVWPGWKHLPQDLRRLQKDPHALRQKIAEHILDEAGALKGALVEWDVINEANGNRDLMRILGYDAMGAWFRTTHEADPGCKLYINENTILSRGGEAMEAQNNLEGNIRRLLAQGAPVHGIGLQSHFQWKLTSPEKVLAILDRFAGLGLELQITEHDIDIHDEICQADYTRDFMTAVFSHPAVVGIMLWGFWEGRHWRPKGAMFREDWSIKPNGKVWQDLVFRRWWTNASGHTDEEGEYRTRGFLGEYQLAISAGEKTRTARTRLTREGCFVEIVM